MLISHQFITIPTVTVSPLVIYYFQLDPFFFIFEILAQESDARSLLAKLLIESTRIFMIFITTYEFMRFSFLLIFSSLCYIPTIIDCLKKLLKQPNNLISRTLRLFIQLRLIVTGGDFFVRNVVAVAMFCSQVLIITANWFVIKCWDLFPLSLLSDSMNTILITTIVMAVFLTMATEINDTSVKFLEHEKNVSHLVTNGSKNRYYFLKWNAQRNLSLRFGIQFTLNRDASNTYFEVLMTNMTNALLLINP